MNIGRVPEFRVSTDGISRFKNRICIPKDDEIKKMILEGAHKSKFSFHPGATKMYQVCSFYLYRRELYEVDPDLPQGDREIT